MTPPELSRTFAHTLVPIGFAYVLAHYFSLLIWQGQAIGYLASDPLGNGANMFGTSAYQIDYTIISYAAIWYVQVAALVAGHVGGLALAHDRALGDLSKSRAGDSLAVLDACRDGGVHELRAVAAVGGGDVSEGVEWPTCCRESCFSCRRSRWRWCCLRRYPGERTLARLVDSRRAHVGHARARACRCARTFAVATRGGLLLARSLAVRPPPAPVSAS